MKMMHIFGAVVAIHLVVGLFAIALPGCSSGSKSKASASDPADPSVAGAPGSDTPQGASPASAAVRFSPTRPGGNTAPASTALTPVDHNYGELTPAPLSDPAPAGLTPVDTSPVPLAPVAATTSYEVQKGDSLWTIARKHGIKTTELAAANNISGNATLRIGQKLVVPAASAAAPAAAPTGSMSYTVVSGDTLGAIARKQGVKLAALRSANNLRGDNLRVGQVLTIPPATTTPVAESSASSAPSGGSGATITYTVKSGDTLGAIAKQHGVKVGAIAAANNITDPKKLRVGQELKIPGAAAPAPAASAAATAAPVPASNSASFNPDPVEYAPSTPAPVPLTPSAGSSFTPAEPGTLAPDDPLFNPGTASPPPAQLTPIVPAEEN
ncbi:LysM repeat-containing protein [Opitutaceae bacterium TAV1]|nr:LysM repeat-containing protein [Opitutaceae bacterium TAV1]